MSKPTPPSPAAPHPSLIRALRHLLGPLVRLLLEFQITFPVLTNVLKSVYVEQATQAMTLPGRPQTISRLSLLTGIHRKDVKRLQGTSPEADDTPASVSLGAQLVLRWTADPEYQDSNQRPMALPRFSSDPPQPSFESLVESVSKDIRPRAILDEWQRLGVATLDAEDRVHLVTNAFVPEHGFDEKAYYLGRNLHDHLAAAGHNLSAQAPPMLERSVYYAKLRPESVQVLQDLSTETGMEALQKINRRARALQNADTGSPDANRRMRFGVYFFHEPGSGEHDEGQDEGGSDADEN